MEASGVDAAGEEGADQAVHQMWTVDAVAAVAGDAEVAEASSRSLHFIPVLRKRFPVHDHNGVKEI